MNTEVLKSLSKTDSVYVWKSDEFNTLHIEANLISSDAMMSSLFRLIHTSDTHTLMGNEREYVVGSYVHKEGDSFRYVNQPIYAPICKYLDLYLHKSFNDDEVRLSTEHKNSYIKIVRNATYLNACDLSISFVYDYPTNTFYHCRAEFTFKPDYWLIETFLNNKRDVCYLNLNYKNESSFMFIGDDSYNKIFK